ncbi:MAG: lycopene cyclase domain-containing protein [Fibrobacteria bacterium]
MNFTYALVLAASIAFPLAFSRSSRLGFGPRWKAAWAAILCSALPFIAWDVYFTSKGIWSFNTRYTLGISLMGLPVEEMLFFVAIPFSCLFIYQAVRRFPVLAVPQGLTRGIWGASAVLLLALAACNPDKAYTVAVCLLGALASGILAGRFPAYSGHLVIALAAQYLPFLLVNGLLTALPVVQYRASEILGYRIGSIPVEDAIYSFIMLVLPVALYEAFIGDRTPPVHRTEDAR